MQKYKEMTDDVRDARVTLQNSGDLLPRRAVIAFLISALICFTVVSCRGRAYHEINDVILYVDAKADWVNTGMRVHKGQVVAFRCDGSWAVAPLNERERWPDAGPGGHGDHPGEMVHRAGDAKKELPGTPFGALLGMVDRHIFAIGSKGKVTMPADGVLYLVINDYPFYRHDNRGGLKVSISKE